MPLRRLHPGALLALLSVVAPPPLHAGLLSPVQVVGDSASGLTGASAIAVSPDGQNAYVTSFSENSIAIFVRDLTADEFRYIGKLVDGIDGVDGLQGASAVAVSADGNTVYVTGQTANALAVFDRSPSLQGLLTYVGVVRQGAGGVVGLTAPTGVAVGPNGRVFVSSSGDDALSAFDPGYPVLSQVGAWRNGDSNPTGGTISGMTGASGVVATDGYYGTDVYVSSPTDSSVAVFSTDALLRFHEAQVVQDGVGGFDGLAAAVGLALSPDGHHLYVAGTGDSAVAVLDRSPNTGLLTFNSLAQQGVAGVGGLGKVDSVCAEPSGETVYAGGGESSAFLSFTPDVVALGVSLFDASLGFVGSSALPGYTGIGSSHVAVASLPDSSRILAAETRTQRFSSTGQLSILARDGSTGALTAQQTLPDGAGVIGVRGAQSVVASPDGKNVYVLGADESLVTEFARDGSTGDLPFLGVQRTTASSQTPIHPPFRNATMSPDGHDLYVFDYREKRIEVFARDAATGDLLPVQAVVFDGTPYLQFFAGSVSPDGKNLYVVCSLQNTLAVFDRDGTTGMLTFAGTLDDYFGPGVASVDFPVTVLVSPDGHDVYVGGFSNTSQLTQFSRDTGTGGLAGFTRVASLVDDANSLAFDETGAHLYVGGDHAVLRLARDPGTGLVTLLDRNVVPGATGPFYSISLAANGRYLYATAFDDLMGTVPDHSQLAVFTRSPADGSLSFAEGASDLTPGVTGVNGAVSVAAGSTGRFVYVAGYYDDAIAVFSPEPDAAALGAIALGSLAALRGRLRRA
jgi:6-phosphogluconolactonase (cycloisomerase 2 family)